MSKRVQFGFAVAGVMFFTWGATASAEAPIAVVFAAGDIVKCGPEPRHLKDEATATLLAAQIAEAVEAGVSQDNIKVLALGDIAYDHGTHASFENCVTQSWGKEPIIGFLLPVPGNHEYDRKRPDGSRFDPGPNGVVHAGPYFRFFASNKYVAQNGSAAGYYSLNFPNEETGPWHLIGLNAYIDKGTESPQMTWMKRDLDESIGIPCVLAFWHPPLFSSGSHGHNDSANPNAPLRRGRTMVAPFEMLYDYGATVVVAGHDHDFEQFSRQDSSDIDTVEKVSDNNGIRSFVVGTGGAKLSNDVNYSKRWGTSEFYSQDQFGVLRIYLYNDRYEWAFIPIDGDPLQLPVSRDTCKARRAPPE